MTICDSLIAAAEQFGERPAVRYAGDSLSYEQLNHRSDQLAQFLLSKGVKQGDRVGLYLGKSLEAVIGVYGIMKAGAAYVPLDPYIPLSRLETIITDCGIEFLVVDPQRFENIRRLQGLDPEAHRLPIKCFIGVGDGALVENTVGATWDQVALVEPVELPDLSDDDLAYILYTSGSTGVPKGVVHTHRSAMSFAVWAAEQYEISCDDVLSNHAPFHFDLSTFDLYAAVYAGALVVIIDEVTKRFPIRLAELIKQERITVWYSVPFALAQLVELDDKGVINLDIFDDLRLIIFAGEVFGLEPLNKLLAKVPQIGLVNLYGPTETNVCTYFDIAPGESRQFDKPLPIGRVCEQLHGLVIDDNDQPVEPQTPGALVIAGDNLMQGYWGRAELNEQVFVEIEFESTKRKYYRTGDLVWCDDEGNFIFQGRADRQVKVKGYRIELDEIETRLREIPEVREAAVVLVDSSKIVSAVELHEQLVVTEQGLKLNLARVLPKYSIPEVIIIDDELPRTSSGKIDRVSIADKVCSE